MRWMPLLLGASGCVPAPAGLELTWEPRASAAVDLLFVIDDSPSMGGQQAELGWEFPALRAALDADGADWRIAVTSTDLDDPQERGRARTFEGADSLGPADADAIFAGLVAVGTDGEGAEQGLGAAELATTPGRAIDALRPGTELVVVVVSDGDDCTDDGALEPPQDCANDPDRLVPAYSMVERLGAAGVARLHALTDPDDRCGRGPATRYTEAAARSSGLPLAWCDPMADTLAAIGSDAAGRRGAFALPQAPDPTTLEVRVGDRTIAPRAEDGWTLWATPPLLLLHGSARPAPTEPVTVTFRPRTGG